MPVSAPSLRVFYTEFLFIKFAHIPSLDVLYIRPMPQDRDTTQNNGEFQVFEELHFPGFA
jgi:hypothetical protein